MHNTVLILGATSDIGRAIAHRYGKEGKTLLLAGRKMEELEADAKDLHLRYNVEAKAFAFEALDYEQHAAFYAQLNPKPELVVCVFGYMTDQKEAESNWAEARQMMEVNYLGAVSILEQAATEMETAQRGMIIGISSVAGDRGRASNYFYGSAKAAFTAYLSGLRNRLSQAGGHVMTVKPGFVDTQMTAGRGKGKISR